MLAAGLHQHLGAWRCEERLKLHKCETRTCVDTWGPYEQFLKAFSYKVGHLIFSVFPLKANFESMQKIFLQSPDSRDGLSRETLKAERFILKAEHWTTLSSISPRCPLF